MASLTEQWYVAKKQLKVKIKSYWAEKQLKIINLLKDGKNITIS